VIGDGQELIDWLASRMQPADEAKAQANGHAKVDLMSGPPSADEAIIEMLCAAANAPKFEALYDRGDVHAYHGGDDSAADLALLSMVAFYTQDSVQLERIFSSSALGQRSKWRQRRDYRERTIDKALADLGEVYQASRERSYPIGKSAADLVDFPI
jgi:primase-polymerase (primpol)-like protein